MRTAALVAAALVGGVGIARAEPYYLIVSGLGGEERYARAFVEHAERLARAARRTSGSADLVTVLQGDAATADAVRSAVDGLAAGMAPTDTLIVFLLGHGSYDGERYKLNLKGPDLDGQQLAELLAGIPARAQLIVNATSASGAVLESWSGDGRIVITATRSGAERNATRFAEHWAEALSNGEADIDKNGAVSAQEAFDFASRGVAESYEAEGTLATEHPQIAGDAAPRFTVARLTERPTLSPELEGLTARLTELEGEIEALRLRRDTMPADVYLDELQALLVQLAQVQQQIDAAGADAAGAGSAGADLAAPSPGGADGSPPGGPDAATPRDATPAGAGGEDPPTLPAGEGPGAGGSPPPGGDAAAAGTRGDGPGTN